MEQTKQLTAASALRKAVSVLMALVLAVGLCPTPKQAWAATGDSHNITWVLNGGSINGYYEKTYKEGTGLSGYGNWPDDDEVTRNGYTFDGWYDNAEFNGSPVTSVGTDANTDLTYYAKWTAVATDPADTSHSITTNGEWEEDYEDYATDGGYYTIKKKPGGLGGGVTAGGVADEGDTIVVAPTAEDDDAVVTVKYTFNGIDTVVQNNYGYYFTMPAGDIHITVTFESPSSGDTDSNYALSFTMDSPSNANEVVTDKTAQATINSITATVNGKVPETEEAAGTLAFQVIGSLNGEEKALSKSVPATWEYYMSSFYRYKKPDAITYSAPEKAGNWSVVLRATWTVNNEVVKTADSPFSWTMTVADEPADEGEFNLIIEDAENGSVTADVAKFDAGDTINLTIAPETGYELDAIEPLAKQDDEFVDASYEAKVVVSDDLATATVSVDPDWDMYDYSDLKLVPTFKAAATKYSATGATVTGGKIQIRTASVAEGETASFTLVPDAGYAYKASTAKVLKAEDNSETGISIFGPFNNVGSFTMPGYDVIVTAEFEETPYLVNIIPSENGTVSADKQNAKIGDTVRLTVEGAESYYVLDTLSVTAYTSGNDDPKVTTVEAGKTYTFQMVNGGATVQATFKDTRAEQTITANDLTLKLGDAATAIGAAAQSTLTYQSSNPDVATVDANGEVTPVSLGTTEVRITAAATDAYQSATKTITVTVEEGDNALPAASALAAGIASVPYSEAATQVTAFKADEIAKATGDVVYVKKSGSAALTVNASTGAVTLASSTAPGLYTANIIVLAAGDETHAAKYEIVPVSVTVTKASVQGVAVKLAKDSFTYNTKAQAPDVTKVGNFTFSADDFDVTYSNPSSTNANSYTITVAAKVDSAKFTGTAKAATYEIAKAANPFATKNASKTFTLANVKKGKGTIAFADYRKTKTSVAQGKMTNKVSKQINTKTKKAVKYFSVDANGKVTVAKKTPKGTYQVTLSMKAAGNANYKASNEFKPVLTVTVK